MRYGTLEKVIVVLLVIILILVVLQLLGLWIDVDIG